MLGCSASFVVKVDCGDRAKCTYRRVASTTKGEIVGPVPRLRGFMAAPPGSSSLCSVFVSFGVFLKGISAISDGQKLVI